MQSRVMHPHGIVLAPAACVDAVEHTSHARRRDGDQKEVRAQIRKSGVRPRSEQERRKCDASPQEGHAQERPWGQGWDGEEPEAGDRDRSLRGAEEGRQGSAEERIEKELLAPEFIPQELLAQEFIPQELAKGWLEEEREEAFVVTVVTGN